MDPRVVPPLPDGCPWAGWALPDIKHCEANLCGWVTAPANTWSNLAFLAAGLWIMTRDDEGDWLSAGGLGPVSVVVGATSFVFHMSYAFAGQVLDYLGMFVLLGWVIARAGLRSGLVSRPGAKRLWAGLVAGSLAALFAFRALGWGIQTVVLLQTLAWAALELRLLARRDAPAYGPLWAAGGLLAAAYAAWHLDHSSLCRPDDHLFQFHALWHVLCAAAFVAAWRFHLGVDERARINA